MVLATGMVPVTVDSPVINLAYRQGPGFRDNDLFDGYADSNFICFLRNPENRYLCGRRHSPEHDKG
ncbi:MAG: hypothetical protein R2861_10260 [Desulfobacterales bacterium]